MRTYIFIDGKRNHCCLHTKIIFRLSNCSHNIVGSRISRRSNGSNAICRKETELHRCAAFITGYNKIRMVNRCIVIRHRIRSDLQGCLCLLHNNQFRQCHIRGQRHITGNRNQRAGCICHLPGKSDRKICKCQYLIGIEGIIRRLSRCIVQCYLVKRLTVGHIGAGIVCLVIADQSKLFQRSVRLQSQILTKHSRCSSVVQIVSNASALILLSRHRVCLLQNGHCRLFSVLLDLLQIVVVLNCIRCHPVFTKNRHHIVRSCRSVCQRSGFEHGIAETVGDASVVNRRNVCSGHFAR